MAAAVFGYAARLPRADRSLPIGGGLALVAAAMAKLFLFDLGTLDGIFRVVGVHRRRAWSCWAWAPATPGCWPSRISRTSGVTPPIT